MYLDHHGGSVTPGPVSSSMKSDKILKVLENQSHILNNQKVLAGALDDLADDLFIIKSQLNIETEGGLFDLDISPIKDETEQSLLLDDGSQKTPVDETPTLDVEDEDEDEDV